MLARAHKHLHLFKKYYLRRRAADSSTKQADFAMHIEAVDMQSYYAALAGSAPDTKKMYAKLRTKGRIIRFISLIGMASDQTNDYWSSQAFTGMNSRRRSLSRI